MTQATDETLNTEPEFIKLDDKAPGPGILEVKLSQKNRAIYENDFRYDIKAYY